MRSDVRRAAIWTVLLTFVFQPWLTAGVAVPPSLTGRIYSADGATPLADAEVVAVNLETEARFTSSPTDVQGRYAVGDMSQGYYDVAVRTADGWFVAERPVRIPSEGSTAVSLSVKQPSTTPGMTNPPPTPTQNNGRSKISAFWAQVTDPLGGPVVGSAIVVGGLAVTGVAVGSLLDSNDDDGNTAACQTDANCGDGDPCTADSCTSGVCQNIPIPGCPPPSPFIP